MRITEIFHSLQGEGELAGVPSVFIRTSGCNLRCTWCDTKYASWFPEGREMTIPEIVAEALGGAARHAVLTGGEPMVARDIHALAGALRGAGFHITIETAGTVLPEGIACDLASISPKLRNSTPTIGEAGEAWSDRHERTRLQPEVLRAWVSAYPYQLKFVVRDAANLAEIAQVVDSIGMDVPRHKVLLMPEGVDAKTLQLREPDLIELCKREGYRHCPRMHIAWFGNTRGT